MANSTTGKIWKVDTAGMLKSHLEGPVIIKHIIFKCNGDGDQFKLTYYDPETTIALGTDESFSETATGTITSTATLTMSAGTLLPSAIVDGSVFEILRSSGSSANVNVPVLVKTAGTNTVVVAWDTLLTNEATKDYAWTTYTSYDFMAGFGKSNSTYHFPLDGNGKGYKIPNLSCETISGSCFLYILT